jgi:hypothetical protein
VRRGVVTCGPKARKEAGNRDADQPAENGTVVGNGLRVADPENRTDCWEKWWWAAREWMELRKEKGRRKEEWMTDR